jgi:hypothetical protein
MSDALSPASRAVLTQIVSGGRIDHVPVQLVALNLVRPEKLKRVDGLVALVWKATKAGRLTVARMED